MKGRIILPKDVENILTSNINGIENLSLLLNKYIDFWIINKNRYEYEKEGSKNQIKGKSKVLNRAVAYSKSTSISKNFYKNFVNRYKYFLSQIKATQIYGKVHWRLVVGLGTNSVLETSMTLHHILGVPYIPGTAVKGMLSTYYIEQNREQLEEKLREYKENDENENKKKYATIEEFASEQDENYIKLFGNQKNKGNVTFLDAYPENFPVLEIDVMNCHYQPYYSGDTENGQLTPPADWLSPNPIKFLTVKKDTKFIFPFITENDEMKRDVETLIKGALENLGIGAKTAVGYGYFKEVEILNIEEKSGDLLEDKKQNVQPLPAYLKSETELKDEFLNSDGTLKTEEE
ncbi:MAG: type III-B CRISPR module RAMP protein Cmr6 [bacterium]|nr:type III-B CRISPR module RAMP protein Cmr6 [bacterium]